VVVGAVVVVVDVVVEVVVDVVVGAVVVEVVPDGVAWVDVIRPAKAIASTIINSAFIVKFVLQTEIYIFSHSFNTRAHMWNEAP
jgi:hypothetical protein